MQRLMRIMLVLVGMVGYAAGGIPQERVGALVEAVEVRIDDQAGGPDIQKLIAIQPGEFFSLQKINYSIKQIYKTGLFSGTGCHFCQEK